MPNEAGRRRSRSRVEAADEADSVRYGDSPSSPASEGAKRMRLRGGKGATSELDEEDDEFHSFYENGDEQPRTNGAPVLEYQPGAIVRVMVENFVTYEHAEFVPGPNLNMIIGPNGTGKSSLVCAICLGLGYHSNVLGRATSFGEFVKHGKDASVVEVELQKRKKDRDNFVIRLRINREDNSRKFWINGKESTHKGVQALMRDMRIQIDNLCQFLPQDKVAEFAGLNSVDLLTKTLQAAAPQKMMEIQDTLKAIYAEQKGALQQMETDVDNLKALEMRQQGQQADVERLREREEIQRSIKDLQDTRLLVEYQEASKKHHDAKDKKKEAQRNLRRLEEESGPSLEAVNAKQEYKSLVQAAVEDRKKALKDAERAADHLISEVEAIDEKIKQVDNKKESEQQSLQAKKRELGEIKKKIASLENAHNKETKEFNAAEWNRKIREQEHLLRDNEAEIRENETVGQPNIKDQGRSKQNEIKQLKDELQALESQQGQKLSQLRRIAPDVAKGWEWLQENKDDFEMEVFGPPMLTCSVRDERYSNQIQSLLAKDDFLCFTTQSPTDHKKLSRQFYREMGLTVSIRTCTTPFETFRRDAPRADLGSLGLDGLALDYIDGPEPVLAMLCAEKRVHVSAVALRDVNEEQYDRIMSGEAINTFATGNTLYRITRRREYGPGATSTRSSQINNGQFWTDQPMDVAEKANLEKKLADAQHDVAQLKDALAELKEKHQALADTEREIRLKTEELKRAKNELQKEYNQWLSLPEKIEHEKKMHQLKVAAFQEARERMHNYEDSNDELAVQKANVVLQHKEQLTVIRTAYEALLEAQVRLIEARSDVAALKEKNQDIVEKLEEERRSIDALSRELDALKEVALRAKDRAIEILGDDEERRAELIELARDKTVESINEDIGAEAAKLELIHAADPGVIRDFENRAVEIERLRQRQARRQQDLEAKNEQIQSLRNTWEPELDELISRINDAFSYNFEQISCAGEVGLHKDEDFEKWAIEIKVKFRENETLQKLDQHRQSGGERAVSTIFYLMSMQSMAQAPFRVVDEINQGMDPRNERMVHERMVEIACREHTSQYFLITPKLLSGLRYDERMRVLCIASGEHMPDQGTKMDFSRCVKIQRRRMVTAAS